MKATARTVCIVAGLIGLAIADVAVWLAPGVNTAGGLGATAALVGIIALAAGLAAI